MWIRRDALEQAGLLDERFFAFGEDIDLCYRIKIEHGWKVYYNPQVVVTHYKSQSMRKDALRMNVQFYRAMWLFHQKHYASNTFFLLNWLTALGTVGLCLVALAVNLDISPGERLPNPGESGIRDHL